MHRVCFHISWVILAIGLAAGPVAAQSQFVETGLVSDVVGRANHFDANLKNPWGISQPPGGPFWVSDNASGLSTLYDTTGSPKGLVVNIPAGSPTGQVFTGAAKADFGGNNFIFASTTGWITAWQGADGNQATTGVIVSGASYTGLAIGNNGSGNFLYAANSNAGIDVFGKNFAATTLSGHFTDPNLPTGFTANNIQNLGGSLYVTYADPTGGSGGVVDKYDLNGNLLQRITANGPGGILNQAWGLAIAPQGFGSFSGDLLVGNNGGDFHINAFNLTTGKFDGALLTLTSGAAFSEDGLWGLQFDTSGKTPNTLFFAAGINGEADGLLGSLTVASVPEPSTFALLGLGGTLVLVLRRRLTRGG